LHYTPPNHVQCHHGTTHVVVRLVARHREGVHKVLAPALRVRRAGGRVVEAAPVVTWSNGSDSRAK